MPPAPALVLGERVPAPQEARVAALGVPLARRGAELFHERGVTLMLVEPAPQCRPAMDQRLMHDLDRGTVAAIEFLHDQQAAIDQQVQQPLYLVALGGELTQLGEPYDRAGLLGGDQPEQNRPAERYFLWPEVTEHAIGVARQRAGHAAHRDVSRVREQAARSISCLPEPCGRELKQRQRAG